MSEERKFIMEDLVRLENNRAVIDSHKVAEMVGKRHTDLLHDIDRYVSVISQNAKLRFDAFFIEQTYTAGTGKNYRRYDITKQGCEMIANKLTGKKGILFTAEYVKIFNEMKHTLRKPDSYMINDPIERAKRWIEEEQVRQELQKANELMKPKAEFYDTVTHSDTSIQMGEAAKVLNMGIGRNNLFAFLRDKEILQKNNVPYQRYVKAGYFELSESYRASHGKLIVGLTTYVT